jgi:hypothetical protein
MRKTAILQESLNYLLALKAELVKFPGYQKHVKNLEKVIKEITKILEKNKNKGKKKNKNKGEKNKKGKSKITLEIERVAKIVLRCLKVIWEITKGGYPLS